MSRDVEALLRDALTAKAESYEPAESLAEIRSRVAARRRIRRWALPVGALAAAAAAVALVLAVPQLLRPLAQPAANGIAGGGPRPPAPTPAISPPATASAAPNASAGTPSGTNPTASPSGPSTTRAVAVYYVGTVQGRTWLYREFHARPAVPGAIRDAVDAMLHSAPLDQDYRSAWPPATQILGVSRSGATVTVDLSAAPSAAIGVQELVWTVTAADPTVTAVQLRTNGSPVGGPTGRADPLTVLARVWVLSPTEGASVPRTFTASGQAAVFEATVSWELRRGTQRVASGFTTATPGPDSYRGPWSTPVTAPTPGEYTFVAYEVSPKDGSRSALDSKQITVR